MDMTSLFKQNARTAASGPVSGAPRSFHAVLILLALSFRVPASAGFRGRSTQVRLLWHQNFFDVLSCARPGPHLVLELEGPGMSRLT